MSDPNEIVVKSLANLELPGPISANLAEAVIRIALRSMRDHCADIARDRPFGAEGWIRRIEV